MLLRAANANIEDIPGTDCALKCQTGFRCMISKSKKMKKIREVEMIKLKEIEICEEKI